jgi:hypothetical protein
MMKSHLLLRLAARNSRRAGASFHSSSLLLESSGTKKVTTPRADPAMRQYKFWNREESSEKEKYSYLIDFSPESLQREAKILSLSDPNDVANTALHKGPLPLGSKLVGVGTSVADFDTECKPNVLFVSPSCPRASTELPLVLSAFPSIEWVHCRSAGIDFVESGELADLTESKNIQVTNAKGQFSSSLAEYALMACSYL